MTTKPTEKKTAKVDGEGKTAKTRVDLSTVKFEKDVPVRTLGAAGMYAPQLSKMNVDESFVLPPSLRSAKAGIASALKKMGFKAVTREEPVSDEYPEGGIRIWKKSRGPKTEKSDKK